MDNFMINHNKLLDFCTEIFEHEGLKIADANAVAKMLVNADLRGVRSHGVIRVMSYVKRLKSGGANKEGQISVVSETPTTAVLDANNSLGSVASAQAVRMAREKARENNISLVTVKRSNHFGMAGYWALSLAENDMIGFCGSNTSPSMPPSGSRKAGIGNNPFAFAYTGERYKEICVDMASSVAAGGKAMDLVAQGKPIPNGWLLDEDGNPTTDINKFRMLLPFSGHKGYGIAFMVETFATLLSGGTLSHNMNSQSISDKPESASQYFGAIRIEAFQKLETFKESVDTYIDFLKSLPTYEGIDSVKYPGEIEFSNKINIAREGICLPEKLVDELTSVANEAGMTSDSTVFLKECPQKLSYMV